MLDLEAFSRITAARGHESQQEQSFAPDFFIAVESDWNHQKPPGTWRSWVRPPCWQMGRELRVYIKYIQLTAVQCDANGVTSWRLMATLVTRRYCLHLCLVEGGREASAISGLPG